MRTAAAVLFVVACLTELGGVWLIWREAGSVRRVLAEWETGSNPLRFGHQASAQVLMMGAVVRELINARLRVSLAITLLVLGIIAGTVATFMTYEVIWRLPLRPARPHGQAFTDLM